MWFAKVVVLATTMAMPTFLVLVLLMLGDYWLAAVCLVLFYGMAVLIALSQCLERSRFAAPPATDDDAQRRQEASEALERLRAAERERFEAACPARYVTSAASGAAEVADEEGGAAGTNYVVAADELCAVCLDEVAGPLPCRVLACRHAFHARCIDEWWLSQRDILLKCPMCRSPQPVSPMSL